MGGNVQVTSEINVGTTFSIVFKVMCKVPGIANEPSMVKQQAMSSSVPKLIDFVSEGKPRILLANDDTFLLCGYQ